MKTVRRYLQSLDGRDRRSDLVMLAVIFLTGLALRLAYIALLRGEAGYCPPVFTKEKGGQ